MVDQEVSTNKSLIVVGIGASAGGLRALEAFFDNMAAKTGAAFVVIQHLSPDFKSLMKELLERHTAMEVHRVTEGMELKANSIYLIPPKKNLFIKNYKLSLKERSRVKEGEINFPIDLFFQSLARSYGDRSIGVILSGSGSDGTRGLSAIDEVGGIALVQDPDTAEFDGMPRSAIATGVVNQVLPPKELAQLVNQCIVSSLNPLDLELNRGNFLSAAKVKEITNILKKNEDFDFSYYKISTLSRRIHRRRLINNSESIEKYIELLKDSPEEAKILCADLLINVTHFFRDPQAWNFLENNVIPSLLENAAPNEELRFWVTACSTGEEAYSLAILIDEALNELDKSVKVKIFATDLDKMALEKASKGLYSEAIIKGISPERLQKYFTASENQFQIVRRIREMLIFAPQDLTKDAGFTKMHFISCRNVLIYMQPNLQYFVLRSLHFSLINQGILFLGESETLGQVEAEFKVLEQKWKIYQKRRDIRLPLLVQNPKRFVSPKVNYAPALEQQSKIEPILEQTINLLLEESNAVALIVNEERQLIQVCGDASKILRTPQGKITNDVTKMVTPELQLPLNTALYRAKSEKKPVIYTGIRLEELDSIWRLRVIYSSFSQERNKFYLIEIKTEFTESINDDAPKTFEVATDVSERILALEYELKQTKENLQTVIEELEATNEEQQASNEELIASNEELQSTNEELHSVNEELHTVNIEYQSKIQELIELNYDVENLLKSTEIGVLFLDSQLKIRKFTSAIKKVIAIRDSDLNRPLEELSYKFDCPDFMALLRQANQNQQSIEREIKLIGSDKYFLMRLNAYCLEADRCEGIVISFVDLDEVKKVQQELQETLTALTQSESQLYLALSVGGIGTWIWSPIKDYLTWDNPLVKLHHLKPTARPNNLEDWLNLIHPEDRPKVAKKMVKAKQNRKFFTVEYRIVKPDRTISYFFTKGKLYTNEQQKETHITGVTIDVTEIREAERELSILNQELEQRVVQRTATLANFGDRLKQLHRLATTEHQELESIFADYLKTGCQMLNLSTGIISQLKNQTYEIIAIESPLDLAVGYQTECQNTYCKEVIETQKTVTYERVSHIESLKNHPVYLNFKLESFIGTPIFVNGNLYGTLNFSDTTAKETEFTREEIEIVELIARDLGQFISSLQAERELKSSENRFRNTFEQAALGMAHVTLEGKFVRLNQKFCQIAGYPYETLIELSFQDITYAEDLELDLQLFRETIAGERDSYVMEKRYIREDKSLVWINLTVSLVRDEADRPWYFISVIEDISDRKAMETALTEANQAKDTFISHMNHELRTPLNSILGFTQILQKDLSFDEQQKQTLNLVANSGEYLLTLINSILEFSKIGAGKSTFEQQDFNLSQLLDRLASTTRHRAETKGLAFNYNLNLDVPVVVRGDETKLQQLLLNLLDNAVKFTDSGAVTFEISRSLESTSDNNLAIRFQVKDTGVGIAAQDMEAIFEPFTHIEKNSVYREGTGLGLTISQKIAQLMDTELHFDSQSDRGTTCWFELNLPEGDIDRLKEQKAIETIPDSNKGRGKKVLIVDDIKENRHLLDRYLTSIDFTCAEANNGRECLSVAESFQPDVILLDILMPEMDGIETLKVIRQNEELKDTIVIFVSANSQFEAQLHAAKMKFEGFLTKPVDLQKLSRYLDNYLSLSPSESSPKPISTIVIPPDYEELQEILELVELGDLEAAIEIATDELEILDNSYHPFLQKVISLARQFQQNQLISFLKSAIDK